MLKSAVARRRHTVVTGVYRGYPAVAPYGLEFFANPPHTRQAKRFIGLLNIDTNAGGKTAFTFRGRRVAPGHTITATATDDGADTSELSAPVKVG